MQREVWIGAMLVLAATGCGVIGASNAGDRAVPRSEPTLGRPAPPGEGSACVIEAWSLTDATSAGVWSSHADSSPVLEAGHQYSLTVTFSGAPSALAFAVRTDGGPVDGQTRFDPASPMTFEGIAGRSGALSLSVRGWSADGDVDPACFATIVDQVPAE